MRADERTRKETKSSEIPQEGHGKRARLSRTCLEIATGGLMVFEPLLTLDIRRTISLRVSCRCVAASNRAQSMARPTLSSSPNFREHNAARRISSLLCLLIRAFPSYESFRVARQTLFSDAQWLGPFFSSPWTVELAPAKCSLRSGCRLFRKSVQFRLNVF